VATGQTEPRSDLERVTRMVSAGALDDAERELRRILAAGDGAAARSLLGFVLVRSGDAAAGERELRRAIELDPDHFPARRDLGRLYLQQQRDGDAIRELRAAARLGPLDRELVIRLALLELASGDLEGGEQRLRALAADQGSVRALLELARSLARRGENQQALEQLERALDVAPNSEELLSARARVLLALRAPVPAIETLEDLTRMHPSSAEYAYLLGVARLQIAETQSGVESLERSLELEPRQALAQIALGLAFKEQKKFAEAKQALLESLELMPGNVDALVALAEAEEALGELGLAERAVERTLELAADAPVALYVLGKIRMTQGRYEEARAALSRAVERDPMLARAHYQLSLAYARLGDRDGSQRHLELYQRAREHEEEQLIELRTAAGLEAVDPERGG
jgi:tetratricopeptide (TPR) repeat protein